jgi:hypothetical protein
MATQTARIEELLIIEEADAWFEYLEATRGQRPTNYDAVEGWAWSRLTSKLKIIVKRRKSLEQQYE